VERASPERLASQRKTPRESAAVPLPELSERLASSALLLPQLPSIPSPL